MIRAICFNKESVSEEGYQKLLETLKCEDDGLITVTKETNCVESFADGRLCRSYRREDEHSKPNRFIRNCGQDLELFIKLNREESGEEPDHDGLVQAVQDGEIDMREFVEQQEDASRDYHDWLYRYNADASVESVEMFLEEYEENLTVEMDGNLPARTAESLISG